MNNPLKYTDPQGHVPWLAVAAGIGAAINVSAAVASSMATGRWEQMSARERTAMIVGSAASGALSGALSAVGGPWIAGAFVGRLSQAGMTLGFDILGTVGSEVVGSVIEGGINAIGTSQSFQPESPSMSGALSDGAVGLVIREIDYDDVDSVSSLWRSLRGPNGPRPALHQSYQLGQYNDLWSITRFNRKAYLVNAGLSGLFGVGVSAADCASRRCLEDSSYP